MAFALTCSAGFSVSTAISVSMPKPVRSAILTLRRHPLVADHIVQGSLADFEDDGVAVGARLARRLGIAVGSAITIISPQGTATAFGTMPRIKTYNVVALFDVGMYEY